MGSQEEDFDALLEASSLGSPGARQLRARTTLNQVGAVHIIAELQEQIQDPSTEPTERENASRELHRVLKSLGYSSNHAAPVALRDAAGLPTSVTDGAADRGEVLGMGNAQEERRQQVRGAGDKVAPSRGSLTDTSAADFVRTTTDTEDLRALIARARVVLWDFDGPICRLFAGHTAQRVAQDLIGWLEGQGLHGLMTEAEREALDPQTVLHAVAHRHPGSDLVAELEERLTQEELRAVPSAMPTPYADPLIRTWTAVGARLAITTNNSPLTVLAYLNSRSLTSCFNPHVYGREQGLQHLKSDPHYLTRALTALGAAGSAALMVGDTPSDLHAAEQAGVPFLGYARNAEKEKQLTDAGAQLVVNSLSAVLAILRSQT